MGSDTIVSVDPLPYRASKLSRETSMPLSDTHAVIQAEAIAEFMAHFARMTKAGMIEAMQEILTIGLDRKLKVSDLEE